MDSHDVDESERIRRRRSNHWASSSTTNSGGSAAASESRSSAAMAIRNSDSAALGKAERGVERPPTGTRSRSACAADRRSGAAPRRRCSPRSAPPSPGRRDVAVVRLAAASASRRDLPIPGSPRSSGAPPVATATSSCRRSVLDLPPSSAASTVASFHHPRIAAPFGITRYRHRHLEDRLIVAASRTIEHDAFDLRRLRICALGHGAGRGQASASMPRKRIVFQAASLSSSRYKVDNGHGRRARSGAS